MMRVLFLDDDGFLKSKADAEDLGDGTYRFTDPDCDMEYRLTKEEIEADSYLDLVD